MCDSKTGTELLVLQGHSDIVTAAAFSPDGNHIVTCSLDTTARIWGFRQFLNKSLSACEVAPPRQK